MTKEVNNTSNKKLSKWILVKEIGFNVKNLSEQELEMLHSLFERSKIYKEFIKNKKNSKKIKI